MAGSDDVVARVESPPINHGERAMTKTFVVLVGLVPGMLGFSAAPLAPGASVGDYPSIQEAIRANPGRMVYVPAGDYGITNAIHLGRDAGGLFGPGRILQGNPRRPILVVEGAMGSQIRDLTLLRREGATETESEGVLAIKCSDLVLENLRVLDNRTRTAAIELRDCHGSQIRNCHVQNYQRVSVDDRTKDADSGYAFKCLIGTGIVLKDCLGEFGAGIRYPRRSRDRCAEHRPRYDGGHESDPRFAERADPGKPVFPERPVGHRASAGALLACGGAGARRDGGSIIANNIISDFGYGHAHWMRAGDSHGIPIRFETGQSPDNPPLRDVIIQGNVVYDSGRDGVLVGGAVKVLPPRYRYAVHMATERHAPPKGYIFPTTSCTRERTASPTWISHLDLNL